MSWTIFGSRMKKATTVATLSLALLLFFGTVKAFAVTDVGFVAPEEETVTTTSDELNATDEDVTPDSSSAVDTNDYEPVTTESTTDLDLDFDDGAASGALGAFALFMTGGMLFFDLLIYVYFALCLQKIAEKTGTPNAWLAWIPIVQIYTFVVAAQKPAWWIILMLIPIVNVFVGIYLWMEYARLLNKPSWIGLLVIIPGIGIVIPGYLAFINDTGSAKPAHTTPEIPTPPETPAPPAPEAPAQ